MRLKYLCEPNRSPVELNFAAIKLPRQTHGSRRIPRPPRKTSHCQSPATITLTMLLFVSLLDLLQVATQAAPKMLRQQENGQRVPQTLSMRAIAPGLPLQIDAQRADTTPRQTDPQPSFLRDRQREQRAACGMKLIQSRLATRLPSPLLNTIHTPPVAVKTTKSVIRQWRRRTLP